MDLKPIQTATVSLLSFFGYLTSLVESWSVMKLEPLRYPKSGAGLQTFKHSMCQYWMDIARARATSIISRDVSPIALIKRDVRGMVSGSSIMGRSFPFNVGRDLIQSLELQVTRPNFDWAQVARVLVSWTGTSNKTRFRLSKKH